jgi:equilibrative nucleoside transporter
MDGPLSPLRIAEPGEATPNGSLSPVVSAGMESSPRHTPGEGDTIVVPAEAEVVSLDPQSGAPPDKRGLAWIIFAVLGVGMLFPWNCFLTASDYFNHVFPGAHFEFVMAVVYNYPSIFMLLLSVKFGERFSLSSRIYVALAIDLVVLILVPVIAYLHIDQTVKLALTLTCVFLTGVATAILFGSVLGLSAFFPQRYTTAVMSGNGVAGLGAAFLRIVTKVSLPQTTKGLETSSTIYFALAAAVLLCCIICYSFLMALPVTRYYLRHTDAMREREKRENARPHDHVHKFESVIEANKRMARKIAAADHVCSSSEEDEDGLDVGHVHEGEHGEISEVTALLKTSPSVDDLVEIHDCGQAHPKILVVFGKIWPSAIGAMLTFMVTLALFPGVTLLIETSTPTRLPQDWFSIILVTLFMIGDFTGRTIPRWVMILTPKTLPIPIVIRCGFVALFWLFIKPDLFQSDWAAYGLMLLFAVSNGYCGTLAMMFGPGPVELYEKESAGTMMSFFLNLGIFIGAHLALVLLFFLKGSWGI